MKSKIGLWLAIIYALTAVVLDIYAFVICGRAFCGLGAVFIATPWIFPPFSFLNSGQPVSLMVYQLINVVLVYLIGVGITKAINHFRNKNGVI